MQITSQFGPFDNEKCTQNTSRTKHGEISSNLDHLLMQSNLKIHLGQSKKTFLQNEEPKSRG